MSQYCFWRVCWRPTARFLAKRLRVAALPRHAAVKLRLTVELLNSTGGYASPTADLDTVLNYAVTLDFPLYARWLRDKTDMANDANNALKTET